MQVLRIDRHALLALLRLGALQHARGGWLAPDRDGVLSRLVSSPQRGAVRWLAGEQGQPPPDCEEALCIVVASGVKGRFEAFAWRRGPDGWQPVPLEMVEGATATD